ncbi:hypothetical protein RYH73_23430 [Olivibacter sp. CPCC 100613]|uniref:hypothetical protein n=1 Tax=Olivibacter sp. CPCC 100613 TaxID=3079931 RepID=UPI002FF65DAC
MRIAIFSFLFALLTNGCTQPKDDRQENTTNTTDNIPLPVAVRNLNTTDKLYMLDKESTLRDTLIEEGRYWKVNGDMFFKIDGKVYPVYIYTSLMKLEVMEPSTFRITAYDRDQGQSVESLSGKIKISKNYSSPFPEPDTLRENNLYMVNKSIDLSEKEDLEDERLLHWWKKVNTDQ